MANVLNCESYFELDASTGFFCLTVTLVLLGLLCEEKYRRSTAWRQLKKDGWSGIRTVEPSGSTQGGWG